MNYFYGMLGVMGFIVMLILMSAIINNTDLDSHIKVSPEVVKDLDPSQPAICTIDLEVSRVNWGTGYYCWVAHYRGTPIKKSPEWADTMNKLTFAEQCAGNIRSPGGEFQREKRFRESSAPYFWQMVEELQAEGWKPIYKADGSIDSMVKGNVQVTADGHIMSMDPDFSVSGL